MQALLLCVVYAVCRRVRGHAWFAALDIGTDTVQSEPAMLAKAVRLNTILVSTCRCFDIFNGQFVLPDRMEECAFTLWLAKEQLHRSASSA